MYEKTARLLANAPTALLFLRVFLNLHVLDGAALHGQQVVLLIDFAPIHHLPDAGFQHVVSYDTECAFAIVRILKCTITLQILIFLYFLSVLLIFVRSSYTAFR